MADERHDLRVYTYFPKVKDFERREDGSPIFSSLLGPDRIEARQQRARERIILGAEVKVLQDELRWCYFKEGVNHYENCKHIVDKVVERLKSHNHTVLKVGPQRALLGPCLRRAARAARAKLGARFPSHT